MENLFLLRHRAGDGTDTHLGYYSTLPEAEARLKNAKWQSAYRGYPDGFSVDTVALDKTFSFRNEGSTPVILVVEPWASAEIIPPGSTVDVRYPSPSGREDTSYADHDGDTLIFWCEGPTYEVEIDGVRIST
jgi:hypothetical protein